MTDPTPAHRSRGDPVPLVPAQDRGHSLGALPTPLTSFVGRAREVAAVADLLVRDDARLVTLTGPGGVGKTRLALRTAELVAARFADGVGFVPLASVVDPALVAPSIAHGLSVREAGERPLLERLAIALREREFLLLLDNFEQVVAAAPLLTRLLGSCPALKLLVTSRVVLRVGGEHEFPVQPLALPGTSREIRVESREENRSSLDARLSTLASSEAVQLFVQRARAVRPDFALTEENVAAVAEACVRLDGLPLAIELGAARAKILSPQALLACLEHRLALLTGGARDQPDRLRTMRDAIAWSHDLLDERERVLFRRLGVFVGGFTIAAAEAVAGDGSWVTGDRDETTSPDPSPFTRHPSPHSVLDGISSLVDNSLLRSLPPEPDEGVPRFDMLETVRDFALEQLAAAGEEHEARRRHAAWCLAMAVAACADHERQVNSVRSIARLTVEHDNLRAALTWLDGTDDREALLRLTDALFWFWYIRGHLREGLAWLDRALALTQGSEAPTLVRARAMQAAGALAHFTGDDARAVPWIEASLAICQNLGNGRELTFALLLLGIVAQDAGDYERASERLGQSLAHSRAADDSILTALALSHLGIVTWGLGDRERAAALLNDAVEIQRTVEEGWGLADSLERLASIACEQGDLERSGALQRESLSLHLEQGFKQDIASNLAGLAVLATTLGKPMVAARLFGKAAALREEVGNPFKLPERAVFERALAAVRAALDGPAFAAAWAAGRALPLAQAIEEALAVNPAPARPPVASAGPERGTPFGLTARELEVLRLLVAGNTDRQIADALFISRRTAQGHVGAIFVKLGVNTRTAAATAALRAGLVAEPPS